LPGGRRRVKPIRDISCPRCGTRAVSAERKPYCSNCHWNVERTRRALKPTLVDSIWLKVWLAFMMYVVKAPWPFLLFAVGAVAYGYVQNIRALRTLPVDANEMATKPYMLPSGPELTFEAKRKPGDYGGVLIFLFPGFAIAGAISLVFTIQSLRIGSFELKKLSDLIVPATFLLLGLEGSRNAFKKRFKTQKILNDPVCVVGVVRVATESGLEYRFRDLFGGEFEGTGTEYSGDYYEEMEVPVMYERNNPINNLPVSALYDEYDVKFNIV
jgi:ribosomal protein L37E